ncbi:hypothetical protein PENSPDRAFT_295944 [Peniophora sp. CONT]|nr:hypothetical protein PENSPDRAFT_295944 [Peniophora sp. CONT]
MIYWSNMHGLPVYLHPGFDAASTVTTAYPHASFSDNFSDESAARNRAELGLPALNHVVPLRPFHIVQSRPTSEELPGLLKKYLEKVAFGSSQDATPTRPSSAAEPVSEQLPSSPSLVKRKCFEEGREDIDALRKDSGGQSSKRRRLSLPLVHTSHSPSLTAVATHPSAHARSSKDTGTTTDSHPL